jgi:lysophospholipase L1-like esterase
VTGNRAAATRPGAGPALAARLLVGIVALGVALALCEIAARMVFPAPPVGTRQPQIGYLADPELRYVMAPSQRGWIDDGLLSINSLGFRGPDIRSPKPPQTFRIVVIGDSISLGWGVADDETFSSRLQQRLHERFPGRAIEVVNLGVGGYNTRQEVTLLARHVRTIDPDLVLVGFYTNDVPEALEDDSGRRRDARSTGMTSPGQIMHINPTPDSWWDRQFRRSRAAYVAGRAVKRWWGGGDAGRTAFTLELDLVAGRDSATLDRAWTRVAGEFDRLHELARERGFRVGVVVLPCREQATGEYSNAKYIAKLRSIADPLGFGVIDPLPELRGTPDARALFIPYDRNHPSAAGHRLIADGILRALTASSWLERAGGDSAAPPPARP